MNIERKRQKRRRRSSCHQIGDSLEAKIVELKHRMSKNFNRESILIPDFPLENFYLSGDSVTIEFFGLNVPLIEGIFFE